MRHARDAACWTVVILAVLSGISATPLEASSAGGVQAPLLPAGVSPTTETPSASLAGGSAYGVATQVSVGPRPVVAELNVPRTAPAGRPPRVTVQIDEAGAGAVAVRVTVIDPATRTAVITAGMGWVPTGRALNVSWPRTAMLGPGSYRVSLAVRDRRGRTPAPSAYISGGASLIITARAKAPPPSLVRSALPPQAGVPTPAQSTAAGAVFPVAGAHSFGGPENRFGAPRGGYTHQGQDVLTTEGTPILAPLAGTISTVAYQRAGAGYYAVEHTGVGFDFMFAHCEAGSLAVETGAAVSAGQVLCAAGQTGDATTPHLYFEIWVGGWQAPKAHTIDPLPYLEAWERTGAVG